MSAQMFEVPLLSALDAADLGLLDTAVAASRNFATGFKEIAEALDQTDRSRRSIVNHMVRDARRRALDCAESWAVFGALAEMQASMIRNEINSRTA